MKNNAIMAIMAFVGVLLAYGVFSCVIVNSSVYLIKVSCGKQINNINGRNLWRATNSFFPDSERYTQCHAEKRR